MTLVDDGDLIRGLGYVALYSAYLEEAIDEVFLPLPWRMRRIIQK